MVERAFTTIPQDSPLEFPTSFVVPEDMKGKTTSFNIKKLIASGSFALIYLAQIAETNERVAIKHVLVDPRYKSRELQITKQLSHPNIVSLQRAFYSRGEGKSETFLNLVLEYVPSTLYTEIRACAKSKQLMDPVLVKLYVYQMLRAVAQMHALGLCHRDIKPQNLLLHPQSQVVKLCDFGSAKQIVTGESNAYYICSRPYRAPELLIGSTNYTVSVDIWSCACVCGELLLGVPVFPGENTVDQFIEIMKILGTPSPAELRAMNPAYSQYQFPVMAAHPWSRVFRPGTVENGIDFVAKALVYDPAARPTALECLSHHFFDELRLRETSLPDGSALPDLFNFTAEERRYAGETLIQKLVPAWYGH